MISCQECGTPNPSSNVYCGQCGVPIKFHQKLVLPADGDEVAVPDGEGGGSELGDLGKALALAAAAVTAEAAMVVAERRFFGGRSLGSPTVRRLRQGAVTAFAGAILLYAERQLARTAAGEEPDRLVGALKKLRPWRR